MNIIIRSNHLNKSFGFNSIFNDPLINAVKEQAPELNPKASYAGYLECADHQFFNYDNSVNGYGLVSIQKLRDKEIKEIKVKLIPL